MKKFIVANWKENKTVTEALKWLEDFAQSFDAAADLTGVILGVSFPLLYPLKGAIKARNLPVKLSALDVSRFSGGAYTGEVSPRQLQGLADYVLIGHSERKRYFRETLADVLEKVDLCLASGVTPILFLSGQAEFNRMVPDFSKPNRLILVFEPPTAISDGGNFHPEAPGTVSLTIKQWKQATDSKYPILYGGSVTTDNAESYLQEPLIDGLVPGQASLEVASFVSLTKKVLKYEITS